METDEERAEETEGAVNGCEGFGKIVGNDDVGLRRNYFENVITGMSIAEEITADIISRNRRPVTL